MSTGSMPIKRNVVRIQLGYTRDLVSLTASMLKTVSKKKLLDYDLPRVDEVLLFGRENKAVNASVACNSKRSTTSDTVGEKVGDA